MTRLRQWVRSLDRDVALFLLFAAAYGAGFLARDLADDWAGVLCWVVMPFALVGWTLWRDRKSDP